MEYTRRLILNGTDVTFTGVGQIHEQGETAEQASVGSESTLRYFVSYEDFLDTLPWVYIDPMPSMLLERALALESIHSDQVIIEGM